MYSNPSIAAVILISSLLFNGCSSEQGDQGQSQKAVSEMSTQVASEDGESMITKVRTDLDLAKQRLASEDKYACCLKVPCDFCALHEASCSCYSDLKAGVDVCIECYAGWQQGNGSDPDISKEDVTTSFVGHEHGN